MEERVEFTSGGETLVGTLFRPDDAEGPMPTVVAAGGWCYVKEIVLPHVARIVCNRGVQVFGFDYRNLGESGGARRQHLDPWMQIEDYQNAVTFLERRPDVNSDRIGAFGISYSGGHVLILAAIDPRIKAVVGVVPVVDGYANMKRVHGELPFRILEQEILDDLRARYDGKDGSISMSTLAPHEERSVWPFPRTYEVFHQLIETEAPRHEHWSTTESARLLLNYSVFPFLPRILNKAVMLIVAEGDNLTLWDLEIDAFNKLPSPYKRLEILPAVSHMSIYSEREDTNLAARYTAEWFDEKLTHA
jgi:pimeloyl-ACP methyl ester carboxylesterase